LTLELPGVYGSGGSRRNMYLSRKRRTCSINFPLRIIQKNVIIATYHIQEVCFIVTTSFLTIHHLWTIVGGEAVGAYE
jgi:hypothetical protein